MPPKILYTVWRNSDDKLLILDGTAEECCRLLNVKKETFYRYACVSNEDTLYTIRKISLEEAEKEVES